MRQSIIAGIVILGLGAFVLLRGASFTSKRDVLKVGDFPVTPSAALDEAPPRPAVAPRRR